VRPIIQTKKHIVQRPLILIPEQTINQTILARVVEDLPNQPFEVAVGAVVKAVWLEYWLLGESAQPCTSTWTVEKLPNDGTAMTQAQSQDLDGYPNKKNILKMGQGIVGDSNSNPIPILREWIKIPKGKQRMGQGDELVLNISCVGEADNGLELCGFAIFKEQF